MTDVSVRNDAEAQSQDAPVDSANIRRLPVRGASEALLRDEQASPETSAPSEASGQDDGQQGRRRWLRPLLFGLLPVVLLGGGYYYVEGGQIISTENAYVRADMVGVSTDVSGIVKDIDVTDNQRVKAGEVLFKLEDRPFQIAVTRAKAQADIVLAELNALKSSYRDMQAQIAQAQVDVDFYGKEVARQSELARRNFASQVSLEQAQRNEQGAQQKVASLTQQLNGIKANLAGDPDIDITTHPRYIAAVAQKDEAARQLEHTIVRAPISGTVTKVPSLQPGQYLAASTSAMSVVADDHVWIEANPKETELTYVRPGQDVTVTVDTYPGQEWHGRVDSLSPASSSSFALLPAQNTSGNWVKVVQRIPIRVRIDETQGKPPLRSGMSAVIDIDTGHKRGLPFFTTGQATPARAAADHKSHG